MYDAVAGRFVSRDPIGYAGSKWNVFSYTSSSPASSLDPTGLVQIRCGCDRFDMNGNMSGNTVTYNVYVDCRGGYVGCCRNACIDTEAAFNGDWDVGGADSDTSAREDFCEAVEEIVWTCAPAPAIGPCAKLGAKVVCKVSKKIRNLCRRRSPDPRNPGSTVDHKPNPDSTGDWKPDWHPDQGPMRPPGKPQWPDDHIFSDPKDGPPGDNPLFR
jgi:hypothetical protein